jgi:hypothetical protein
MVDGRLSHILERKRSGQDTRTKECKARSLPYIIIIITTTTTLPSIPFPHAQTHTAATKYTEKLAEPQDTAIARPTTPNLRHLLNVTPAVEITTDTNTGYHSIPFPLNRVVHIPTEISLYDFFSTLLRNILVRKETTSLPSLLYVLEKLGRIPLLNNAFFGECLEFGLSKGSVIGEGWCGCALKHFTSSLKTFLVHLNS